MSSSSITVNGVNVTKAINFSPLPPPVWAFKGAYINYIVVSYATPMGLNPTFILSITVLFAPLITETLSET